jgi:PPM family protein phosphatase
MGSSPTNEGIEAPNVGVAEHAALSDVGSVREGNEDAYLDAPPLFVVADGMGGASAGEVASGIVVEEFRSAHSAGTLPDALTDTIQEANARIYEMARQDRAREGMGTTCTAAMLDGAELTLAHVGDSRAYRLRGGELVQLTDDHSLVAGLVRLGKLTQEEADVHPQRSVILRAVGVERKIEVDVAKHPLEEGDLFLLCSDGLSGMVRDEVIAETLRSVSALDEAAEMLIDLANASGGRDNITAVLFRIGPAA